MKSLLALGIIVLLPLLAIFSLIYFRIHKFQHRIESQNPILNQKSIGHFTETVAVR